MKTCNRCKEEKTVESFDKTARQRDGFSRTCKVCKKQDYLKRKDKNPIHIYFVAKRSECKQKDIEFNLDEQYLIDIWTDTCPIFHTPMKIGTGSRGDGYNSHLDRIDPNKGYIKGNVAWISGRANRIKYNATAEELRMIAEYIERATTISKESTPKQVETNCPS